MKIKLKNVLLCWVFFVVVFSFILIFGIYTMNKIKSEAQNCLVEENIAGLPNIQIREIEKEIVVEKKNTVYEFPFEVSDKKLVVAVGVISDNIPKKKYNNMEDNSKITVYASSDLFKEGSLIWIEDVGIRQVQGLADSSSKLYICMSTSEEADSFGEKEVNVFEILE